MYKNALFRLTLITKIVFNHKKMSRNEVVGTHYSDYSSKRLGKSIADR